MEQMISICGLTCSECPAFIATKNDDNELRTKTAGEWSEMFKAEIKMGDINCLGCSSKNEPLFSHCKVCNIRKCGMEKEVVNCAYCDDYICDQLDEFFKMVPDAKKQLDSIKATF